MAEVMENTPYLQTDSEHLKLTRNRNGYTWEIKILKIDIKRLEEINDQMLKKFGDTPSYED